MEDGGFFQGPWNHCKEELTQLTGKKMSLAGYWLFLIPLPICQCSHGFLSAGFFSSAPNPLGFGRAGFSSRHQMRAGGMTHPEKLRLVPRATLLIPTCHLGTEKQESAPASHPTAFWMGSALAEGHTCKVSPSIPQLTAWHPPFLPSSGFTSA